MKIYKKLPPNWPYDDMKSKLLDFDKLYKSRPIKKNDGGMKYPHMFGLFYILNKIKPDFVVESGIWKGQSTWLIEKVLPNAKILSIDLNLKKREYISKNSNVTYSNRDFINHDFSKIIKNSLVFFDDHQNSYERLMQSYFLGFRKIIFDDNYPALHGDMYSLKKIFNNTGFNQKSFGIKKIIKSFYILSKYFLNKTLKKNYMKEIHKYDLCVQDLPPEKNHFLNLDKLIKTYYEFPPIYKSAKTFWGDAWSDDFYPTEKPIYDNTFKDQYKTAYDEADSYNWLTYVELNDN